MFLTFSSEERQYTQIMKEKRSNECQTKASDSIDQKR